MQELYVQWLAADLTVDGRKRRRALETEYNRARMNKAPMARAELPDGKTGAVRSLSCGVALVLLDEPHRSWWGGRHQLFNHPKMED